MKRMIPLNNQHKSIQQQQVLARKLLDRGTCQHLQDFITEQPTAAVVPSRQQVRYSGTVLEEFSAESLHIQQNNTITYKPIDCLKTRSMIFIFKSNHTTCSAHQPYERAQDCLPGLQFKTSKSKRETGPCHERVNRFFALLASSKNHNTHTYILPVLSAQSTKRESPEPVNIGYNVTESYGTCLISMGPEMIFQVCDPSN